MKKEIQIIYEDENIIAVNKPAGLVVHSDGRTKEATLSDWVLENYPEACEVGEPIKLSDGSEILKHGIVHRLDRETSGVILVAKNQETFLFLKRQFQDRKINKVYRAVVYGSMKNVRGTVDKPIGKSKKDFRVWAVAGTRGVLRDAVTEYKVLCVAKDFSYIEVYPKTGRTHQIRVHMKAIQHPVVCDRLYAPNKECGLGVNRVALHALSIDFSLRGGERIKIEAPLPEDLKMATEQLLGCEIE
jgi:23S rRNA pseudouridine1911/1915/1917 synthase